MRLHDLVDELAELGEVATLHHRHHLAVPVRRAVTRPPVTGVLGVEPPGVPRPPGEVGEDREGEVAVVRPAVPEDEQGDDQSEQGDGDDGRYVTPISEGIGSILRFALLGGAR